MRVLEDIPVSLQSKLFKHTGRFWSFSRDDLVSHPEYFPLSDANRVLEFQSFLDVCRFKEGSVQWDLLHIGRLTSSKAATVLGVLEPEFRALLGIPRSLSGSEKSQKLYERLKEPNPFESLEKTRHLLLAQSKTGSMEAIHMLMQYSETHDFSTVRRMKRLIREKKESQSKWTESKSGKFKYNFVPDPKSILDEKEEIKSTLNNMRDVNDVRLYWGALQEATGILLAINYFQNAKILEVGLFPSEALLDLYSSDLFYRSDKREAQLVQKQFDLLHRLRSVGVALGATPDGLIAHDDESVEPLEIKNHCFVRVMNGDILTEDQDMEDNVPVWYIPQIQLEIFCCGWKCMSAILIRVTATKGAKIFRVYRDEEFLQLMLQQILNFKNEHVLTNTPPKVNYSRDSFSTKKLVMKLKEIQGNGKLVKSMEANEIQRHPNFRM